MLVGLSVSFLGAKVLARSYSAGMVYLPVAISIVLLARESRLITFRLPEFRRQTDQRWARRFGYPVAPALWGFDIGFGFLTWIKYGGFWALIVAIFIVGDSWLGPGVMVAYWIGRVMPVLLGPFLRGGRYPLNIAQLITVKQPLIRITHIIGLILVIYIEHVLIGRVN